MAESVSLSDVFDLALEARHSEVLTACNEVIGAPGCPPELAARAHAIIAFSRVLECRFALAAPAALTGLDAALQTTDAGAHLAALAAAGVARAMGVALDEATVHIDFDALWSRRAALESLSDEDHAIVGYLMIEAAMSSGRLREAQVLARDLTSGPQLGSHRLQACAAIALSRSLAFQGKNAEALDSSRLAVTLADNLADDHGVATGDATLSAIGDAPVTAAGTAASRATGGAPTQALAHAILAYSEAQVDNRKVVDEEIARVIDLVAEPIGYLAAGSWILSAFALAAISRFTRARELLLTAAGGPGLPYLNAIDRAYGYEILATDAIERRDLNAARDWGRRLATLENHELTEAAVERTLSRIDLAIGDFESEEERAAVSSARARVAGGDLDAARTRLLEASAPAATGSLTSGSLTPGISEFSAVAFEADQLDADQLGAAAVSIWASRELRRLGRALKPNADAGWSSLSDRERQVATLAAEGFSNREIGRALYVSERTVQSHISRVLTALGVTSPARIPAALNASPRSAVDLPALTARQRDVAALIAVGLPNREISERLDISDKTVEKHVQGIFVRWGVESRTAIARVMRDVVPASLAG